MTKKQTNNHVYDHTYSDTTLLLSQFKTKDAGIKYGVSVVVMKLLQLTLQSRLFVQFM